MNPLTLVKRTQEINAKEAALGISEAASWHAKYKESAYVFVGGIPFELTEGDILAVFAQYGEIVDVNLVRDKGTGKSKGFAFVAYEDQRSTNLAVDNLNGASVSGRIIRVDHCEKYKKKEEEDEEAEQKKREERGVCRAFQKGECTRGAGCRFSHDEQRAANTGWGEKEDRPSKRDEEAEEKKREERGICYAFQKGECTRGAGCRFSHDEQRAANTGWGEKEARPSKRDEDRGVCYAFQKGECTRGAGCRFSHAEQRAAITGRNEREDRRADGRLGAEYPARNERQSGFPVRVTERHYDRGELGSRDERLEDHENRHGNKNDRDDSNHRGRKSYENESNLNGERDRRDEKRSRKDEPESYHRGDRDSRGKDRSARDSSDDRRTSDRKGYENESNLRGERDRRDEKRSSKDEPASYHRGDRDSRGKDRSARDSSDDRRTSDRKSHENESSLRGERDKRGEKRSRTDEPESYHRGERDSMGKDRSTRDSSDDRRTSDKAHRSRSER